MTIDEAIKALQEIKNKSKLGGNTCLSVCLVNSEVACSSVDSIELDEDADGALAVVMVQEHDLRQDRLNLGF